LKQCINLGNHIVSGKWWFKKMVEFIFWWKIWDFFEKLLKTIWLPSMIYKKRKLDAKGWWIIIWEGILKFHGKDIRKKVNLLMRVKQR
jgi:hypothetical protein